MCRNFAGGGADPIQKDYLIPLSRFYNGSSCNVKTSGEIDTIKNEARAHSGISVVTNIGNLF